MVQMKEFDGAAEEARRSRFCEEYHVYANLDQSEVCRPSSWGVCDGTRSQLSHTDHVDLSGLVPKHGCCSGGLQSSLLVPKVPPSPQPTTPPRLLQKASAF